MPPGSERTRSATPNSRASRAITRSQAISPLSSGCTIKTSSRGLPLRANEAMISRTASRRRGTANARGSGSRSPAAAAPENRIRAPAADGPSRRLPRDLRQQPPTARPQPAGILGERVDDAVIAVMREQRAPKNEAEIIGDVERRDQPERGLEARLQIGRPQLRGERPDRVRIARKARIGRHPVVFERDPIRPHITEIGREHGDAARPRLLGRDDVIGPPVAVQDEIGDLMPIEHAPR